MASGVSLSLSPLARPTKGLAAPRAAKRRNVARFSSSTPSLPVIYLAGSSSTIKRLRVRLFTSFVIAVPGAAGVVRTAGDVGLAADTVVDFGVHLFDHVVGTVDAGVLTVFYLLGLLLHGFDVDLGLLVYLAENLLDVVEPEHLAGLLVEVKRVEDVAVLLHVRPLKMLAVAAHQRGELLGQH